MSGLLREGKHYCDLPDVRRIRITKGAIWECWYCGKQFQWRNGWGWMRRLRRYQPAADGADA